MTQVLSVLGLAASFYLAYRLTLLLERATAQRIQAPDKPEPWWVPPEPDNVIRYIDRDGVDREVVFEEER